MTLLALRATFRRADMRLNCSLLLLLLVLGTSACISSQGFLDRGGTYSATEANGSLYWGSYGSEGDRTTGRLEIPLGRLGTQLAFRVAGYASQAGIHFELRDTDGHEYPFVVPNAGEHWNQFRLDIPVDWLGRRATLVVSDESTAPRGWVAVELPEGASFSAREEAARPWSIPGAVFVLTLLAWLRPGPSAGALRWPDRVGAAVAVCLLTAHFSAVMSYAVDVPIDDEWEALLPDGIGHDLNWGWVFRLHNEHRIASTKLLTWALFSIGKWNLVAHIALNFLLYVCLLLALCKFAKEHLRASLSVAVILGASTISAENLSWAFQTQFHLYLLFFILALHFGLRKGASQWLGAVSAILCAFSFSTGVVCAAACAGFYLYLGLREADRPGRARRFSQATVVAVALGFWFLDFHTNPGHPPFAFPWEWVFWDHYFNALASGFGYSMIAAWPGATVALALCSAAALRIAGLGRDPEQRDAWVAVLVMAGATLAGLGAVSLGRAHFGVAQAKASRYAEVSFMLVPVGYLLVRRLLLAVGSRLGRSVAAASLAAALFLPFADDFSFSKTYGGRAHRIRIDARRCITDFYAGRNAGYCPSAYPVPIPERLRRARSLGVSFAETLSAQ